MFEITLMPASIEKLVPTILKSQDTRSLTENSGRD